MSYYILWKDNITSMTNIKLIAIQLVFTYLCILQIILGSSLHVIDEYLHNTCTSTSYQYSFDLSFYNYG